MKLRVNPLPSSPALLPEGEGRKEQLVRGRKGSKVLLRPEKRRDEEKGARSYVILK